jgi:hypothetical protein
MDEQEERWLRVSEVAALKGCSRDLVSQAIREGKLPFRGLSKHPNAPLLIPESAAIMWMPLTESVNDGWLSVYRVSEMKGTNHRVVQRACDEGKLRGRKVRDSRGRGGERWVIDPESVPGWEPRRIPVGKSNGEKKARRRREDAQWAKFRQEQEEWREQRVRAEAAARQQRSDSLLERPGSPLWCGWGCGT